MNKRYISLIDYKPREPGELRISKDDHIVFEDIDDGWCRGRNLSTGQQGIFPKLYLGTSRSCTSPLHEIISDVAAICSRVDRLIAASAYLTSPEAKTSLAKRLADLHAIGPFFYLTSGCAGGIWEQCLRNFVSAFQATRVQAHEYLLCIETLKRYAGQLDRCLPELAAEVRKFGGPRASGASSSTSATTTTINNRHEGASSRKRIVPTVLGNAECMQATLRGLINTACQSFELYCHNNAKSKDQQAEFRPSLSRSTSRTATTTTIGSSQWSLTARAMTTFFSNSNNNNNSSSRHPTAETHIYEPTAPDISPTRFFLLSYPTLQALTIITCLVATTLQLRAYALTTTTNTTTTTSITTTKRGGGGGGGGGGSSGGTIHSPDFYTNLQSTLMQSLTTYTGLVPALRVRALRGLLSVLWVALLSVAGLVLNLAAVAIYFHDAGLSPLLSFFGNVAQAITVLHLAIRIEKFVVGGGDGDDEDEFPAANKGGGEEAAKGKGDV